jgi:DNA primase
LDKAETAIVGAALEVIQRIGPCNAKVKVHNIEDVRISKRSFVVERAKQLLKQMMDSVMPDSQEIADEVAHSVRVMEVTEYGKDRCPAGPGIEESDEVIVVEGRADVVNLLKHGFKNVIAMNGTSIPPTIVELSHRKDLVAFVDGDRGGNLILRDLLSIAEIDFVTRAPDGKEVEELAKKEIHKALRSRITAEQAKLELASMNTSESIRKPMIARPLPPARPQHGMRPVGAPIAAAAPRPSSKPILRDEEKKRLGEMLEGLIGTRGAYVLDDKMNVLGKVPFTELNSTLKSLNTGVYAVVFDGIVESGLVEVAEKSTIKHIIAMDTKVDPADCRINIVTAAML